MTPTLVAGDYAVSAGPGVQVLPSRTMINRREKEYGDKLGDFLSETLAGRSADSILADGTKCHSQEDVIAYNDVHVTLGEDTGEDDRLSDYKRPKSVEFRMEIPWTPYGKHDKFALRDAHWRDEDRDIA